MRKLFVLLVWGMMVLQAIHFSVRAEGVDLEYTMIVTNPESHKAQIIANFTNLNSNSLKLTMAHVIGEYFEVPIDNFKAYDSQGKMLDFNLINNPYEYGNERFWIIKGIDTKSIAIEYEISMNFIDKWRDSYIGYLDESFGCSYGGWVFLVPTETIINSIRIKFNLPTNWKAATPWTEYTGYFSIKSMDYLITSTFAIGEFTSFAKQIRETRVIVAVFKKFEGYSSKEKYVETVYKSFEYLRKLFDKSADETYLMIFIPSTKDKKSIFDVEWTQSQALPVLGNFNTTIDRFNHRAFHIWNLFPPTGIQYKSNEERWLIEGLNDYYDSDKILFNLRLDVSHSTIKRNYYRYLNEILNSEYDIPLVQASQLFYKNLEMHDFLNYKKSALIFFLLDYRIRELTNGQKSLDDILKYIYNNYGHYNHNNVPYNSSMTNPESGISNMDFEAIVSRVIRHDFSQFFKDYVHGTKKLELNEYLKDNDR